MRVFVPPRPEPIAPKRGAPQQSEETVDPEVVAREAGLAVLDAKRIARLLAALQRMGEI